MSQKHTRANPNPQAATITPSIVALAPAVNPIVVPITLTKDFGMDQNPKTLLKILKPKAFIGEGRGIPNFWEEWSMFIDDYFALAKYNALA